MSIPSITITKTDNNTETIPLGKNGKIDSKYIYKYTTYKNGTSIDVEEIFIDDSILHENGITDKTIIETATITGNINAIYGNYNNTKYDKSNGYRGGLFENCTNLTTLTFEKTNNLYSIGYNVFRNCKNLEKFIHVTDSGVEYNNTFPSSVTSIWNGAFENCTKIKSFNFLNDTKINFIGDKNNDIPATVYTPTVFTGCNNFTVSIPIHVFSKNNLGLNYNLNNENGNVDIFIYEYGFGKNFFGGTNATIIFQEIELKLINNAFEYNPSPKEYIRGHAYLFDITNIKNQNKELIISMYETYDENNNDDDNILNINQDPNNSNKFMLIIPSGLPVNNKLYFHIKNNSISDNVIELSSNIPNNYSLNNVLSNKDDFIDQIEKHLIDLFEASLISLFKQRKKQGLPITLKIDDGIKLNNGNQITEITDAKIYNDINPAEKRRGYSVGITKSSLANGIFFLRFSCGFLQWTDLKQEEQEILEKEVVKNTQQFYKMVFNDSNMILTSEIYKGSINVYNNFSYPANFNICFAEDTFINTDQGIVKINKLTNENTINNNRVKAITMTKLTTNSMILIKKNAIQKNIPNKDTYISRDHKVLYNHRMVEAKHLVNKCKNIIIVPYDGKYLYNILLEKYKNIIVNNMVCETLDPNNILAKLSDSEISIEKKQFILNKLMDKNKVLSNRNKLLFNR